MRGAAHVLRNTDTRSKCLLWEGQLQVCPVPPGLSKDGPVDRKGEEAHQGLGDTAVTVKPRLLSVCEKCRLLGGGAAWFHECLPADGAGQWRARWPWSHLARTLEARECLREVNDSCLSLWQISQWKPSPMYDGFKISPMGYLEVCLFPSAWRLFCYLPVLISTLIPLCSEQVSSFYTCCDAFYVPGSGVSRNWVRGA